MSDEKIRRRPRDANRVNLADQYEAEYWSNRFSVPKARLQEIVDRVGADVDAISEELNGNQPDRVEAQPPS